MADFQEIFEELPDGVTLHDASDGAILETNQQFCELLGYSREELLSLDFQALHVDEPPYTSERAEEYIRNAATDGSQTFEWLDATKEGDPLPVEVHLSLTTIDGEERILAVVRDITERKRRERVLEAERNRANALFEKLGEPIVEVEFDDGTPSIDTVNEAFEETFGIQESAVVGTDLIEFITPESEREWAQSLGRRVEAGEVVEAELVRSTAVGERTFLLRTVPYSLDGTPRAYVIYFDITDRKRREERFEAFIEQSTDVISVLAPDGTYEYLSPSAERILGYDVVELLGEVAFDYVHPDDRERVMSTFAEAVSNPEMVATAEFRFRHGDGTWIWLESIGNNQLDNPAIEGFIVNSRDVTDRKANEFVLEERTRELERQNERLDEFAGVLSHDLRNPLNVAQGRLELAREQVESDHFGHIENALSWIETLIDDTLTLARHGEQVSDPVVVDLAEAVDRSWETITSAEAGLEVHTERTVRADESRLRQLIENVLRNAVEHGGGDVTVTVGDLEDGFYIEDDGSGIPADQRDEVFRSGYTTSGEGTGFGLAIVRQIAEAHHWESRVTESAEGGARFEFTGVHVA